MNPELDLHLSRVIRAPRQRLWDAWTNPEQLAHWFIPEPTLCRVKQLDVWAGGAIVTEMSDDGVAYSPHIDGTFIRVDESTRLLWTNAIDSSWHPRPSPDPVPMTAEVLFEDHLDGTRYTVNVRHADPEARARHEKLGFHDGWGSVTEQLATLVEKERTA